MKRYAGTLVLLGLAVAMGAYIFFVESRVPSTGELREREKRLVHGFDRNVAKTIRLERGKEKIVLERDQNRWRILEPVKFPADSGAVESLLSAVEFLESLRRIEANPAEYGLDEPRARILIEGGPGVGLRVGADDPTGRNVYARSEGDGPIYVVEHGFLETLLRPLSDLKDKHALPVDRGKIETLSFVRDGTRTALERKGSRWYISGPAHSLASQERVESLVTKVVDLKATRVVTEGLEDLAKYGLDASDRSIEVGAGGTETLVLGAPCGDHAGELYAARRGTASAILCIQEESLTGLLPEEPWIRETRLLPMLPEDARRIVIESSGKKLVLVHEDDAWKVSEPSSASADEEVVARWLNAVGAFRATRFLPLNERAHGLTRPARVTVEGTEGTFVLAFGATVGGARYVRRDDEGTTMMVHAEVSQKLTPDALAFRKRRLLDFSRYDVKSIVATGGNEEEARKAESGAWSLTRPSALPGDSSVIDSIAGTLAELTAERFVAEEPAQGLSRPSRELLVTVEPPRGVGAHEHHGEEDHGEEQAEKKEEGPRDYRIQVGRTLADGTCYGRLDGEGPAFVLAAATCKNLATPMVTRKLFDLDESKIVGFSLRRGKEEEIDLEKRGPDWYRVGKDKVKPALVEDLLEAIRNARAEDVFAYGAGGIASPRIVVAVRTDGQPDQTLAIGGALGDGIEARIAGRDVRYVLNESVAEALESLAF